MALCIKELCKQKGITLKDLANNLGISYQSLYDSIGGNPTLNRLEEIAKELGVDVPDLFERKDVTLATLPCPHCGKTIRIYADCSDSL